MAGVLAVCGAMLLLAGVTAPALAQPVEPLRTTDAAASGLSLELLSLHGVIDAEDSLRLRVDVRNSGRIDRDDVRVLVTVHRRTIGRWQFQQAMGGGELGSIVHPHVTELEPIPRRGSRTVEIEQSASDMGLARGDSSNVYPLRVQLLVAGEVVDEVVTSLVVVPSAVAMPLSVALLVPLGLPPARDAEGVVVEQRTLDALQDGGILHEAASVIAAHPDLEATLALDGHTLADVADMADGYTVREDGAISIRPEDAPLAGRARGFLGTIGSLDEAAGWEPLALPYAQADLVSLVRNGMPTEVDRHVEDGAEVVAAVTGRTPPTDILWPAAGIDGPTLARVRRSGIGTLVLAESALAVGNGDNRTPSPVRRLRVNGGAVQALVPDALLTEPLMAEAVDGPVVAAQRLMAEIASVYFEAPGTAGRGLLIAPPEGSHLPTATLAALADPLQDAPFVRMTPVSALEQRVRRNPESVALAPPPGSRSGELPSTYVGMLANARRGLGSLAGVLEEVSTLPTRLDALLLQAASVHYRGEQLPEGRALLRAVTTTVDDVFRAVDVLESPPVTLTDVEGQLPVAVRNTAAVPLRVRVSLESARYEVAGGSTREVILQPDRTEILTFGVRARTPGGTSPVQVVVRDMAGDLDLAQGTVVVRSTAFSVAGVITTAGAALVLFMVAVRQVTKRRRDPDSPRTGSARQPSPGESDAVAPAARR
jgi:hypothetical protein